MKSKGFHNDAKSRHSGYVGKKCLSNNLLKILEVWKAYCLGKVCQTYGKVFQEGGKMVLVGCPWRRKWGFARRNRWRIVGPFWGNKLSERLDLEVRRPRVDFAHFRCQIILCRHYWRLCLFLIGRLKCLFVDSPIVFILKFCGIFSPFEFLKFKIKLIEF